MTKLRLLPMLLLTAALSLPAPALAQEDAVPVAAPAGEDTRIEDLQAIVPDNIAGLPLRETLQLATGEALAERMEDEERAVFEAMLEANSKTFGDYVAANAVVRLNDTDALIIQPHRVTGIDAAATIDTWVEILSLNAQRPSVSQTLIDGREVFLVSDDAQPEFPQLRLFAAGDVVWMVVVDDDDVAAEAVRTLVAATEAPTPEG